MIGHLKKWGSWFRNLSHGKQMLLCLMLAVLLSLVGALGINYYNDLYKDDLQSEERVRIEKEVQERLENPIFRSKPEVKKVEQ